MNIENYLRVSNLAYTELQGENDRDSSILFLSVIFLTSKRNGKTLNEYISLSHQFLGRLLGTKTYSKIIKKLLERGFIERDNYIVGEKSFGYRLAAPYRTNIIKPVITDKVTRNRLKDAYDVSKERTRFGEWVKKNLRKLHMDTELARLDFKNNPAPSHEVEEDVLFQIDHYENKNKYLYSIVDNTAGRNHTNFTNLNGNLRNYLTVDGNKLCLIDVKNSQPYFAIKLYDNMNQTDRLLEEKGRYIQDVTKNGIYEVINGGEFKDKATRNCFKISFLTAIYQENKNAYYNPVWRKFRKNYPLLARQMVDLKRFKYSNLAITLQRFEAKVFVDGILRYFSNNEPDFFCLGLHDGLLMIDTEENRERLKEMVLDGCERLVGVEPVTTFDKLQRNPEWTYRANAGIDFEELDRNAISA